MRDITKSYRREREVMRERERVGREREVMEDYNEKL